VICHKLKNEETSQTADQLTNQKTSQAQVEHPKLMPVKLQNINSICGSCHDNLTKASGNKIAKESLHQHSVFKKNTCVECHNPHSSKFPDLTKLQPKYELCLSCHKDIAKNQLDSHNHKIEKMNKGCLSCHEAHFSTNAKLLLKDNISQVCVKCHKKEMKDFASGTVHEPVQKGECYSCHQVHGSKKEFLVEKEYSSNLYESFDLLKLDLCFKCHKPELATERQTTTATNFRNADLNLHFMHLSGQKKQRTCRACHEVHSSHQEKLILSSFKYKEYELPLNYIKTKQGGKCATVCHQEKSYHREKAIKNE